MTSTQTKNPWLKYPKPNPQAQLQLFCFPYAGGGAQIFRLWPASLPPTVEVCAVELPGRGTRLKHETFSKMEPLVEAIAQALLPQLDKPFAFFGHSMGALVSFELARLLRKQYDRQPAHLFASGRCAPQIPDRYPPMYALPEAEFVETLCRRYKGMPSQVLENAELMQIFLPVLRADFSVLDTYVYRSEPALDFPITVFGGWQDESVNRQELEAWAQQTNAAFDLQMFTGDHFFIDSAKALLLKSLTLQLQQINQKT